MTHSQPQFSRPRARRPSVRQAALLLLALVLSLTLRPALAWAEQGEAPVQIAQTGSAADEPAAGLSGRNSR